MADISHLESEEIATKKPSPDTPRRPRIVQRKEKRRALPAKTAVEQNAAASLQTVRTEIGALQLSKPFEQDGDDLMVLDFGDKDPDADPLDKRSRQNGTSVGEHDDFAVEEEAEELDRIRVNRETLNNKIRILTTEYQRRLETGVFQLSKKDGEEKPKIKRGKVKWRKEIQLPGRPLAYHDSRMKWHGEKTESGEPLAVIDQLSVTLRDETQDRYDDPRGEFSVKLDKGEIVGVTLKYRSDPPMWRDDLREQSWTDLPGLVSKEGDFWHELNEHMLSDLEPNKEIIVNLRKGEEALKLQERDSGIEALFGPTTTSYSFDPGQGMFHGERSGMQYELPTLTIDQFVAGVTQLLSLIPSKPV